MKKFNNQIRTKEELEEALIACEILRELLDAKANNRPFDPALRKRLVLAQLRLQRKKYEASKIPEKKWPGQLQGPDWEQRLLNGMDSTNETEREEW